MSNLEEKLHALECCSGLQLSEGNEVARLQVREIQKSLSVK